MLKITSHLDFAAAACGTAVLLLYLGWAFGLGAWLAPGLALVLLVVLAVAMVVESSGGRWVGVLLLIALAVIALGTPSADWDARSIWLFHARRIYFDRSLFSQLDGYAAWSHNDYPVLVPAVSASLAALLGRWNEIFPKVAGLLVMAPALFLLMRRLSTTVGQLAFAVLLVACAGRTFVNGFMDGLLALYVAAALALLVELLEFATAKQAVGSADAWPRFIAAIAIFSSLTLLKNEGVVALGCVVGAAVVLTVVRRQPLSWPPLAVLGVSLLLAAHWKWRVVSFGVVNDLAVSDLPGQLLKRLPYLSHTESIIRALFLNWQFLVPASLFVVGGWRHLRDPYWQASLLAAVAYSSVLFVTYLSTPNDLAWHLYTSAARTVLPVAVLLGFAGIRALTAPFPRESHTLSR